MYSESPTSPYTSAMSSPALSAFSTYAPTTAPSSPALSTYSISVGGYKRHKRKAPPSLCGSIVDLRYPPFDPDDPLASLSDLRRRSFTLGLGPSPLPGTGTGKYSEADVHAYRAAAESGGVARKYELTVDLPPFNYACPIQSSSNSTLSARHEAFAACAIQGYSNDVRNRASKSALLSDHNQSLPDLLSPRLLRRRPSSNSTRSSATVTAPSNPRPRSKFIPSKRATTYAFSTNTSTPPLSPDNSDSSSPETSFLSLHDNMSHHSSPVNEAAASKRQAGSFVKRLLPKRSNVSASASASKKRASKDTPRSPTTPSPIPDDPPCLPFPRASSALSDSILNSPTLTLNNPINGAAAAQHPPRRHSISPLNSYGPERVHTHMIHERTRRTIAEDDEEHDFPQVPGGRRIRLFSFTSRSILRTRVDIVELEKGAAAVKQKPRQSFEEYGAPSIQQVYGAASRVIVAESGVRVRFGELIEGGGKTVVLFIRHFRCTACQDYVRSLSSEVDIGALERAGLRMVIVGLGSPAMIAPYRLLTNTSLPIFTDPTLAIHRALGMTLRSTDPGPESERGHYVHHSTMGGIRRSLADLVTHRLPAFEKGGDIAQLGGEFVFGPGLQCLFAHRMKNTRAHLPIHVVVRAAGYDVPPAHSSGLAPSSSSASTKRASWNSMEDEDAWMARRRHSLARLREKRNVRRLGMFCETGGSGSGGGCATGVMDEVKGRYTIFEEKEMGEDTDTEMGLGGRMLGSKRSDATLRQRPGLKLTI